jgi:SAM-dependent methyltransferase
MSGGTIYEDGTYLSNHPTWDAEDSAWKAGRIGDLLRNNGVEPSTVCDVGCGAGEVLSCLAREYGADVRFSGYEISPQALEICRTKERDNLHYFPAEALDDAGDSFDVVMAIDVAEHVEDYLGFLRSLRARGEYKVFHFPLDLSVQSVLRSSPILDTRASVGHLHYFTKETALATLRDSGYEVVDAAYTSWSLDLPSRGWKAGLAKAPRRLLFSVNQDMAVRILGGFSLMVLAK